jgi:lipoprotein NlpI
MRIRAGFAACIGLLLTGCAGLAPPATPRPLLALGEQTFYLHPLGSNQSQVDVILGFSALSRLSSDVDKEGHCKTDKCRENWQSTMADIGAAYSRLGLHLLAINYYREGLRNAADPTTSHSDIAIELDSIGRVDAAQKEFDLALETYKGKDAKFEQTLGWFYLLTDRFDESRSRFEQCVLLGKPENTVQYCAIGLALTKWNGGNDSMLLALTAAGDWPGPILSFARDQIDEKTLAEKIRAESNPEHRRERLCEALYYVGEWHLRHADKALALRYFRASVRQRVEGFWETGAAARRIEQLHGNDDPRPPPAPASHIPIS